jgi:hypothetical protein
MPLAEPAAGPCPGQQFCVRAGRLLPPFVIMSSCGDHMVPFHEGAEFVTQLHRCARALHLARARARVQH